MSLLSTMMKKHEEVDIKMVKYELNTVENLKKAKENLSRDEVPTRKVTDEVNTTLELHPALYLEVKKGLQHIKKGGEAKDEGLGVKMIVTYIRRSQTPKGDSPGAIVRLNVTNLQTGEGTKCAVHYYHTKQNIHLQGGHRMGKVTTTSLVADFLLKDLGSISETRRELLVKTTDIILKMDLDKFEQETKEDKTTKKPSETSIMVPCDQCSYKSIYEWNVIRHKKIAHEQEIVTSVKRSFEPKRVVFAQENEKPVNISITSSPPGKKSKEEANHVDQNNTAQTNVEQEIVAVVENLEGTNNENEKKIKAMEDANKEMKQKIRSLTEKVDTLELKLNETQHHLKETITERDMVRGEYTDTFNALQKLNKDKLQVEVDYSEVVQKINQQTRENEETKETLKVTEDILKAIETERKQLDEDDNDEDPEEMEGDWFEAQEVVCKKCYKKVSNNGELREHLKIHIIAKLKCHYCDHEAKDGNNLLDHISESHIKVNKCLTCNKSFKGKEALATHVIADHAMKTSQTGDKCKECGKMFSNMETLISHLIKTHYLVNPHRGDEVTRAGHQLDQSWTMASSRANNSMKCYECGQDVGNKTDMMRHKRENHYKEKLCRSFHEYGHCERSDEACIYIHVQYERQSRQNSGGFKMCRNGPNCIYKIQNRCKFSHQRPAAYVEREQNQHQLSNVTTEATMKAVLERLVRMEQMVPDLRSNTDFPTISGNRRSQ